MAYVYLHRKTKDDSVFYVGKGSGNRLLQTRRRNNHWNCVTKNNSWYAQKVMDNLTDDEAFELEEFIISEIGLENLTNQTPGGEGMPKGSIPWNKGKTGFSTGGAPKGNKNRLGTGRPDSLPNLYQRVSDDLQLPVRTVRRWLNKLPSQVSKNRKDLLDEFKSHPVVQLIKRTSE